MATPTRRSSMHGGMSRGRRSGRGPGSPVTVYPLSWWIIAQILGAVWRFCSGQVVMRRPGRWDSRYLTWAADPPENVVLSRDEGVPRSRWARRPGWHRQATRFGAIALVIGLLNWPVVTVALTVVAIAVVGVRRALDYRELAYYHRVCGSFLEWTTDRVGWADVDPDPREWIELPPHGLQWEPAAPLRAAVLADGADPAEHGWLARHWPRLTARLAPLTAPVADWRWVLWLIGPREGRPRLLAAVGRFLGRVVVRVGEASRWVRVRPRFDRPDLTNPDAEIVIHYPATYQAHGADVSEIERVVTSRMPDGPWKFRHNADALTITMYHPTTLPRLVTWDRTIFKRYSQLELPIGERAGQNVVVVDLKGQTPHINASGKTGRGKTVAFLTIIGGFLYHGGHVVIVDPKRIDFVRPFKRLPNVDLVTMPERFPLTLRDVDAEMERRYQLIEQYTERADELGLPEMEKNAELYFQPLLVSIDEKSGFTAECNAWWKREGNDGEPGKGQSITVDWERNIVARGRACCVYAMAAAQQNALGTVFPDTDIRSNYQYKILAGPADTPSWMVTFPGERKRGLSSDVKGRAIVGVGSDLHEVQLAYVDPGEIREAAIHGLEVRDKLNQERAERLAMITGKSVWEVSPLPWWVTPPAETPESVPGQDAGMDTPAPTVIEAAATALTSAPEITAEMPGQDDVESDPEIHEHESEAAPTSNDGSNIEGADDSNGGSNIDITGDRFGATDGTPERIMGNRAAARYLRVNPDTFRRARSRAEENGDTIPGMGRDGKFVTFDPVQLAEWWNQRPGSGRQAG